MNIKTHVAERIRLAAREYVPKAMLSRMNVDVAEDVFTHSLVAHLTTYLHGMAKERVQVHERWPADWWQAFKERWLPAWALRRWPVTYKEIRIDQPIYAAVCPHIEDEPRGTHLQWMATEWERAADSYLKPSWED